MRNIFLLLMLLGICLAGTAQSRKTENVVIITLDGMRWEEVFGGIDAAIMNNKSFTRDSSGMAKAFWSEDTRERRKKLFPFLWTTIAQQGQLYGNRHYDNKIDN